MAAILGKVLELNPKHAKKRNSGGIRMVEEVIARQGDPDALRNYVQEMIKLLDEAKCPLPDAEQWNTKLNEAYDNATQGTGAPAALSRFQKGFPGSCWKKQPCANVPQMD